MYAKRQALRCTTCAETAYLGVFRVGITFLKSGGADFKKLYTRHTNAKKATLKASGWHFTTLKIHNLNRRNNYYFLYIYANQDCYIYNRYHQ